VERTVNGNLPMPGMPTHKERKQLVQKFPQEQKYQVVQK